MLEFIQSADEAILQFLREHVCGGILNYVMLFFTYLGEEGIIWILFALAMLIFPKYRKYGVKMALALLVMLFVNNIFLKPLIARPRPFVNDPSIVAHMIIEGPSSWSFPSGHTASSFAAAFVFFRNLPRKFGVPAIILAAFIGLSRLYIGVHYPTDVLFGVLSGFLLCLLAETLVRAGMYLWQKKRS